MKTNDMNNKPLPYRMAPRNLDEYIGQEHILGKGKMLRRMIEADQLSSIILFGPPGVGKTALARLIANKTEAKFVKLNAVTSGVSDIKETVKDAVNPIFSNGKKTVLFIDEIHRFNKLQQDALLPYVEDGTLILIGATTENPFFEVNKALVSRSTVFQLHPLTNENIVTILKNAISDKERGYGDTLISIDDASYMLFADMSGGDARNALKALELAVTTTNPDENGYIVIDKDVISECMQRKTVAFDKNGENHYDNISAMIKSIRGSDADATIHYLAKAIVAGEDIEFLARRIVISAAEDVGLANPNAILVANAAYESILKIGMPEARIILAHAAIFVATSPKSNKSYLAIDKAIEDINTKNVGSVPMHLRNSPVEGMKELGYKVGYLYPHDFPNHIVKQQYMPDELIGTRYYEPTDIGYEKKISDYVEFVRRINELN